MLNTKKLLYILPDVSFVAEGLPGKKPHTFVVQSFRQINGEFTNQDEFITDNIEKLFTKLESEEYTLVLPDHFFTSVIFSIEGESENKVKDAAKEKVEKELNINKDTHQIKINILNVHAGKTRVQVSAIENSLLNPIIEQSTLHKIKIEQVVSLSWTLKSLISLEPSISLVQMGSNLFLAEQYIGVEQNEHAPIDDIDKIIETIKTLKGAQTSIQTAYLLTNELVEEKLKEGLGDILPLQQLTIFKNEETQIPPYVKQVIEAGMKTLSIEDYGAPSFALPKKTSVAVAPTPKPEIIENEDTINEEKETMPTPKIKPEESTDDLPTPAVIPTTETPPEAEDIKEVAEIKEVEAVPEVEKEITPEPIVEKVDEKVTEPVINEVKEIKEEKEVSSPLESQAQSLDLGDDLLDDKATSPIKKIIIFLSVFLATVGIGALLGFAVLTLTKKTEPTGPSLLPPEATPTPIVEVSPTPVSSSSATTEELEKSDVSILVVNATTKAGYAGQFTKLLNEDGYTKTQAGNAKGEYEEGFFVLMEEEDEDLIASLEMATELELTYAEGYSTEDPSGKHQAVIVLAQE